MTHRSRPRCGSWRADNDGARYPNVGIDVTESSVGKPTLIVDAQMHTFRDNLPAHPWVVTEHGHGDKGFGPGDVLSEMNRVGVDRCVLVPSKIDGGSPDLAIDGARKHPHRLAVVVGVSAKQGPPGAAELERLFALPEVIGARALFTGDDADALVDGSAEWIFETAGRIGMPLYTFCPGRQTLLGEAAARHPDVRFAICHFGLDSKLRNDEIDAPIDELISLAKYPNIAVNASALPIYVTDPYPFASLSPRIERVVDAFGPNRVFWGSDLTRLACDYAELKSMFLNELDFLSASDLELIMGKAICSWLNWP